NANDAMAPNTVRTAWSAPHLIIRAREAGPALSASVASSASLVGLIPNSVHGQGAMMAMAPIRKPGCEFCHHAIIASAKPAGAIVSGVLLALAVHMLGVRYGLDLGGLWRSDSREFMPAGAAIAWWLIATVGFSGGYFTADLMHSAASGQIPMRMRQFLVVVGVLILAGAGQAASAPSPLPTISGVLAGLAALCLGAVMAFCGAHFALRKA